MNKTLWMLALYLPLLLTACDRSQRASLPAPVDAQESGQDEHAEGHIQLTPEQVRIAGIEVADAGPAAIRETLPLYGAIAPNAERVREVSARFPGVIRSVRHQVGDAVKQGQTLATVESDESLQTYDVPAPLGGVITARNANPGEQTGDKSLFVVADLSTVWVELSLFPRDVAKARVGQQVRVRSVDANLAAEGRLVYVAPFGSSASQTLTARVQLDNEDRRWAPGLYVSADVVLAERVAPVAIRDEALQTWDEHSVVFVQGADGGFEPRAVRIGRSDGERSEVLEGLAAGERYVTKNSFILKSQLGAGSAGHSH